MGVDVIGVGSATNFDPHPDAMLTHRVDPPHKGEGKDRVRGIT